MGAKSERELIQSIGELDDNWEAQRAPGSGSRQDANSGDVWIARKTESGNTDLYIAEEKYKGDTDNPFVFFEGKKLDKMIDFAENIGATPILAVRFSDRVDGDFDLVHYCIGAREPSRTDGNNITTKPKHAIEEMQVVDEFFK